MGFLMGPMSTTHNVFEDDKGLLHTMHSGSGESAWLVRPNVPKMKVISTRVATPCPRMRRQD